MFFSKGFPLAENLAKLFQDIVESKLYFYEFHQSNFSHISTIEEAIDKYFERLPGNYQKEYDHFQILMENREKLNEELKFAHLYLKPDLLNDTKKYWDLGLFHYKNAPFTWDDLYEEFS